MKKIKIYKNKEVNIFVAILLFLIMIIVIYLLIFGFTYLFTDTFQKSEAIKAQVAKNQNIEKNVGEILTYERLDRKESSHQISEYWELRGVKCRYAIIEIWYNKNSENYTFDSLKILETYDEFKKGIHSKYKY